MKYENYNEVTRLIELCESHKKSLAELDDRLVIKVQPYDNRTNYITISADADSEHDFAEYAREFITVIKNDLLRRIANIEAQIETL